MPLLASLCHEFEAENAVFGEEHVLLEDIHVVDPLLPQDLRQRVVAMEVLLQRPPHDGPEPVGGEGTRQDGHVPKGALQGLVEDVRDLVLEVLHGDDGVQQLQAALPEHGVDLAAGAAEVLVVVEALPEGQQRPRAGLRPGVDEDDDLGVQDAAEGVEEPAVRVDLLAVLLLQAEHELHGRQVRGVVGVGAGPDELLARRHGELRRELEDVRDRVPAVDVLLDDAVLVHPDGREHVEHALVRLLDAVEDQAHHDLLPRGAALRPEGGLLELHDVADVLHHPVQGPREEDLVLVVVGDGDHELGVPVVRPRAQVVPVHDGEFVGVARCGRVAHFRELLAALVLRLYSIQNSGGDRVVDAENGTLNALGELDLPGATALETASFPPSPSVDILNGRLLSVRPTLFWVAGS